MKIMKIHRNLSRARLFQLIGETWNRDRDPVQPSAEMIKTALSLLIDKDFLEYDEKQSLYGYIA